MKIETSKAPIGCDYLNEFMADLPKNCLFDKGKTGCGGTTVALTNEKDTIIAMPFVSIIKNKIEQAKDKEKYPHDLLGVYAGVTEQDILEYVESRQTKTKKILVTYDSLERLINTLQFSKIDVYSDYFLLIDEWHILFNSYAFRNTAIKKVLRYCIHFKEVTYMTATPIEEEFILEELKHLPIVRVE
ncbi:MAG: DEAD/DEAH box helicase family protein [Paludibacter sp.]|jgi:hypothetical protein|nr:DEAD/DEAH box helicase family protein [Paludibacter sp.]